MQPRLHIAISIVQTIQPISLITIQHCLTPNTCCSWLKINMGTLNTEARDQATAMEILERRCAGGGGEVERERDVERLERVEM